MRKMLLREPEKCWECNKIFPSLYPLRSCSDHIDFREINSESNGAKVSETDMIPLNAKTTSHGLCRDCGKGGFLADDLCKDCIQRRAVDEHFTLPTIDALEAMPKVVKIKKGWD